MNCTCVADMQNNGTATYSINKSLILQAHRHLSMLKILEGLASQHFNSFTKATQRRMVARIETLSQTSTPWLIHTLL
jgi:hypothetical protein